MADIARGIIILFTFTVCFYKSINILFFVHLVAIYSNPTSNVIEVRLMVPDKKILYFD
jgi:hypothetical protein